MSSVSNGSKESLNSIPRLRTKLARALYNNRAESRHELEFKKNDVLTVIDMFPENCPGWWLCNIRGSIGLAPANRLHLLGEVIPKSEKDNKARTSLPVSDIYNDSGYVNTLSYERSSMGPVLSSTSVISFDQMEESLYDHINPVNTSSWIDPSTSSDSQQKFPKPDRPLPQVPNNEVPFDSPSKNL